MMKTLTKIAVTGALVLGAPTLALAVPSLQLGPEGDGWAYVSDTGTSTNTWLTEESSFSFGAYAIGSAFYDLSDTTAYIVFAGIPDPSVNVDMFDLTVTGGDVAFASSGYGTPPIADPNAVGPHGVYDTYFEIYSFTFTNTGLVCNTESGGGCTEGFLQMFDVVVNSSVDWLEGIHIDLYTVDPDGQLYRAAPFSHDMEYRVPEPGTLALFGLGLLGLGLTHRRLAKA